MTHFLDGPAKGQHLMLKRAVRFLRVTESRGKWDALDQPADEPRPDERLYAYEIAGEVGMCHIRASGGRSGFYPIAEYRVVPVQPLDPVMRNTNEWAHWCESQSTAMLSRSPNPSTQTTIEP
jgi:hypothetical protein